MNLKTLENLLKRQKNWINPHFVTAACVCVHIPRPPPHSPHVTGLKLDSKELFSSLTPMRLPTREKLVHQLVFESHTVTQSGEEKQKAPALIGSNRLIPTFDPAHTNAAMTHAPLHMFFHTLLFPSQPTREAARPDFDPLVWNFIFLCCVK